MRQSNANNNDNCENTFIYGLNDDDDSFTQQSQSLLLNLEARWNQIETAINKKKNQLKPILFDQEDSRIHIQCNSSSDDTFTLANLIHKEDTSFEVYAHNKIGELEQLKNKSIQGNNDIEIYSNVDNENAQSHPFNPSDPFTMINDNTKIEKKLKSVFSLIGSLNENKVIASDDNAKNSKPKKTFLKEKEKNDEREKKNRKAAKYMSYNNNSNSNTQDNRNNIINNNRKGTIGGDNDIKNKIKENAILLKQLFPIK